VTTASPPTAPEGAERRRFFAELVASGRFCRDTPLGGILHRGTVSLREVAPGDSLHVCIDAENRVSVHVDHYSPVAGGRPDGTCEYSVRAVVTHLVAHLRSQVQRLARGARGQHRCRLECELVEDDVEEASAAVEAALGAPRDGDCSDAPPGAVRSCAAPG
jgi:hypothetical protein